MKSHIPDKLNEETLRTHVLVPYLKELGLSSEEIKIEKLFRIRLGRVQHEIKSNFAMGRADLLVQNSTGDNLFVVEVKRPGSKLSDADRDQGISYARLLDQIAPFVLLTNGEDSRLFDTITKEKLDSEAISSPSSFYGSGRKLTSTEDIRIRWEALRHFFGYSVENVEIFSRLQIKSHLEPLKGKVGDDAKFIRSLYVRRSKLRKAVERFLAGPGPAFVVAGDSGTGKTNELCALAEDLSDTYIVLFLAAYNLTDGPGEALLKEFNWTFSHQINQQELLTRLSRIHETLHKPVVILIDGLDEAPIDNFPILISEFSQRLKATDSAIKLIASIKSTAWPAFERVRNNPSGLTLALSSSWIESEDNASKTSGPRPFNLSEFTEAELDLASEKYKAEYNLPSTPKGQLRKYCSTPFWLRIVSESYAGRKADLPRDITESDIANKWLERKFSQMLEPDRARRDFHGVVEEIYKRGYRKQGWPATMSSRESVLDTNLSIQPSQELFDQGVIGRTKDEHGRYYLRVRHSHILSFFLAKHVLRIDQLDDDEFRRLLPDLHSNPLLKDALAWHLREGSYHHITLLEKEVNGWAFTFLDRYTKIRDSDFIGFRSRLEPYTEGQIGMAYSVNEHGLGWYGFRAIDSADDKPVVELGFYATESMDKITSRLHELGCTQVRADRRNFVNTDPELAAAEFAFEGTKYAIADGDLDNNVSDALRVETICAICSAYRGHFALTDNRPLSLPFETIVPLDLLNLKAAIHRWFGAEHFLRKRREEELCKLQENGRDASEGNFLFGRHSGLRYEAMEWAATEVAGGQLFAPPLNQGMKEIAELASLIDYYLAQGIETVDSAALPLPDHRPQSGGASMPEFYSDEGIMSVIRAFFSAGLSSYKRLVERNFPTLASKFPRYSSLPLKLYAVYFKPIAAVKYRQWGRLEWGLVQLQPGEDPTPSVTITSEKNPRVAKLRYRVAPNGQKWESWTVSDLSSIFCPYSRGHRSSRRNPEIARNEPIRAFVYDLLEQDFESISAADLLSSESGGS